MMTGTHHVGQRRAYARGIAVAAALVGALTVGGCELPESRVHDAYPAATNRCDVPIVVAVEGRQSVSMSDREPTALGSGSTVAVGERFNMSNPLAPVEEVLYVSVARPDDARMGEPTAVPVEDVEVRVDDDGNPERYHVIVEGDLCP